MDAAEGVLTARGGMTSHAAVVARGMGKCCVAGCSALFINEEALEFYAEGKRYTEGDFITLNGSTGHVLNGQVALIQPELSGQFGILMEWADEARSLGVRTNADTPEDAKNARQFGAEGIGLCRTEHMFFGTGIDAVREMILADETPEREAALAKLLPHQRSDFIGIFEAMRVILSRSAPSIRRFTSSYRKTKPKSLNSQVGSALNREKLSERIEELHEFNPMLGHRGCRLGIVYPEITEMQARAIFEAAVDVAKRGITVLPEIMIPLVGHINEFSLQRKVVVDTAETVFKETGTRVEYLVGTMIELPRAALTADKIAAEPNSSPTAPTTSPRQRSG